MFFYVIWVGDPKNSMHVGVYGQRSVTLRRNARRRFKKLFSPRTKETFHPAPSPAARSSAAYFDAAENPRRAFLFCSLFTDTAAENKKKYVRSSPSIRIYEHVGVYADPKNIIIEQHGF